jgi:hypothetical protein
VLQQRQSTRLFGDILEDGGDEAGLKREPGPASGLLNRLAQALTLQRAD